MLLAFIVVLLIIIIVVELSLVRHKRQQVEWIEGEEVEEAE